MTSAFPAHFPKPISEFQMSTILDKQNKISVKLSISSYPLSKFVAYVLEVQKNRLNETVLSSTHNICFG